MPNLGINIGALNIGANYKFGKSSKANIILKDEMPNKHLFLIKGLGGIKEIYPLGGKKYLIGGLSLVYNYKIMTKTIVSVGSDVFYNSSISQVLYNENQIPIRSNYNIRNGLFVGYGLTMGKTEFGVQLGLYIRNKNIGDGSTYSKVYLNYDLTNKIYMHLSLKTHLTVADYFGLGIGYRIKRW